MKKLYAHALEQKEDIKHGEVFFPVQKYVTHLKEDYPVVTMHWHEEAEFTLVTEGMADYQIHLADYPVTAGDILFIPPHVLHSISLGDSLSFVSDTYVFHMNFLGGNSTDICSTKYLLPLMNQELSMPCVITPKHPAYSDLHEIFEHINDLYENARTGYELSLKAFFLQTVFLLLQFGEQKPASHASTLSHKLKQVLDYMEVHYAEDMRISELAGLCYFSEYHFMRFFKKHMNMTCVEYINNLRLEKAVEMFEQGNTSILDVSLSVGFHNLSYFHKLFKRKYHMTPKSFLREIE